MSGFPLAPPLLFAQARIEAMPPMVPIVESANKSSSPWLIALAFATLAIAVVACAVLRFTQRHRNDNWQLFKELCHANQLSCTQSRALRKLSKRLQVANPSRLFLESELWDPPPAEALPVGSIPVQADTRATTKADQKLDRLREHLFVPVA